MQQLESVVRQQWKQQQGNLGMVYGNRPRHPSLTINSNIVCIRRLRKPYKIQIRTMATAWQMAASSDPPILNEVSLNN